MSRPTLEDPVTRLRTVEAENERLRDSMRALIEKIATESYCRNCHKPVWWFYPPSSDVRYVYDIDGRPHYTTCRRSGMGRVKESL